MKMKKLTSLALSSALALSLSVPAFAVDVTDLTEGAEVEITGTTEVPTIKVVVPATGKVILNPYGMTVTPEGGSASTDQIISAPQFIQNASSIPIKVGYTVTGTTEGDVALVTTDPAASETAKQVHLQFTIAKQTDDTATTITGTGQDVTTTALVVNTTDAGAVELDKDGDTNAYAGFQLSGKATKNPDSVWTADDTIGATVAFTFAPNASTT